MKIESDLLRELRQCAARQGLSCDDLTNELLLQGLRRLHTTRFQFDLQRWQADLQPGVDLLNRSKLFDHLDGQ